jgi:nucleotidyltransferase-like protein
MHFQNGDDAYTNTADALCHWPETCTAVAARAIGARIELLTPFGIDDLISLIVRPTPAFANKMEVYRARVASKLELEGGRNGQLELDQAARGLSGRAAEFGLLVRATHAHSRIAQTGSMQPKQPRQRSATRTMPSCRGMSTQSRARAVPSPTCR